MTTRLVAISCWTCTRYQGERQCSAFKGDIPDSIWSGENDHSEPVPGDGGETFRSIFPNDPPTTVDTEDETS